MKVKEFINMVNTLEPEYMEWEISIPLKDPSI